MSAFFKPKAAASPVISRASAAGPSSELQLDKWYVVADPIIESPLRQTSSSTMSDFHRTFKGIQERANIAWAPSDRWKKARRGRSQSPTELLKRGVMTPQKIEEWANPGASSIGQWQPNGESRLISRALIFGRLPLGSHQTTWFCFKSELSPQTALWAEDRSSTWNGSRCLERPSRCCRPEKGPRTAERPSQVPLEDPSF